MRYRSLISKLLDIFLIVVLVSALVLAFNYFIAPKPDPGRAKQVQ